MKIMVMTEALGADNKVSSAALNNKAPVLMMKTDSALLTGGRPLFVPDDKGPISAACHLVVRIGRLGKSIPRRFAYRYVDGIGLGLDVRADEVVSNLAERGLPWDEGINFDGGAVTGLFLPPLGANTGFHEWTLSIDGEEKMRCSTEQLQWQADELIAHWSTLMQLRQGDLLFAGAPDDRFFLNIGQHVEAVLDGKSVLKFNVR